MATSTCEAVTGGRELTLVTKLKEALAEVEEKVVTGYTLADAIREGASVSDQAFGRYLKGESACALASAFVAATARGFIK